MILYTETQNNVENVRNKPYKIVENTPEILTNKLMVGGLISGQSNHRKNI